MLVCGRGIDLDEVTYGFYERDIALLADSLLRVLGIHLFLQQSPMIGPWYSSMDLNNLLQIIKKARESCDFERISEINDAAMSEPDFELRLNDPDPYYSPAFPDEKVHCILRIRGKRDLLDAIEDKLHASGLKYVELKMEQI